MDASKIGRKTKLEDGQRTFLSTQERSKMISYFKSKLEESMFSILVSSDDIKKNRYTLQAGQYFDFRAEELDFDIDERLRELSDEIREGISRSRALDERLLSILRDS